MREYLIKRFVLLIPTFIGITLVVYSRAAAAARRSRSTCCSARSTTRMVAQRLRAEWGLDQPIMVQYAKWLWHIRPGRLGAVDVLPQTGLRRGHGQAAPDPGAGRPGPLL